MSLGVEFLPVDVTQLVAVALGCMIPLIFVVGITMRFAAKPLVEALGKLRENGAPAQRAGGAEPPGAGAGAGGAPSPWRPGLERPGAGARERAAAPALAPGEGRWRRCRSTWWRWWERSWDRSWCSSPCWASRSASPRARWSMRCLATRGEGARPVDIEALKVRIDALEHELKELSGGGEQARPSFAESRRVPIRP